MDWELVFLVFCSSLGLSAVGYLLASWTHQAAERLRCNYLDRYSVGVLTKLFAWLTLVCYRLLFFFAGLLTVSSLATVIITGLMLVIGFCNWVTLPVLSVPPTSVY